MLKFLLYWAAFHTLGRLPLPFLYALMGGTAWLAYQLATGARRNIHENLRHVMPQASEGQMRRAAKRILRNVAFYYADVAHLPRMDIDDFVRRRLVYHGMEEHVRPAIETGRGVILLSAHYGNPELAVQGLIPAGVRVFALTEPVHPRLSRLMDRFRASKGHSFGPVNVGNVKRVIQTLKKGGVVALMGDRDIQGPKAEFLFFGVPALMPTGPIEVALRTGAIVIPAFSFRRQKYGIEVFLEEPLDVESTGDFEADVRSAMLQYIARLERRLREDPGQWAVLEKIWDGTGEIGGQKSEVRGQKSEVGSGKAEVIAGERGDG